MSLADAILYEASFQIWLEGDACHDRPDNREGWIYRSPEERVALALKHAAERAKVAAMTIHRGPRDRLAARKERG